jgi:hypothetical protein
MARKDGIADSQKFRHHRDGPKHRFTCSIADAYASSPGLSNSSPGRDGLSGVARGGAFSNRVSFVNGSFFAAPGHGSLRGWNNPPQHLVRSTGAAMSTTSWHTTTPLKAHPRSHPYPRPAGNHHIRASARMNPMNNGVRRRLRGPTRGTAVPNAKHYEG